MGTSRSSHGGGGMHEFLIQEGESSDEVLGLGGSGNGGSLSDTTVDSSSSSLMDAVEVDTSLWRVRRLDLVLLNFGWAGLACVIVAWGVVMLPSQVRSTVPNDRVGLALAAIVVVGSLLTVIVTPLIGVLSDRSTLSYGRRRPLMLLGLGWIVVAQICLGLANPHKPQGESLGCEDEVTTATTANATAALATPTAFAPNATTAPTGDDDQELHGELWVLIVVYGLATIGYQVCNVHQQN